MAFSTQKDFFHVPFMNEDIEYECRKCDCVKLKSYESTIDDRSWALDGLDKSRYFTDLVSCRTPICKYLKKGSTARMCARRGGACTVVPEKMPCGDGSGKRKMECEDSLICAANEAMANLHDVLQENCELRHQLDNSYKCLESAAKERDQLHERLKGVIEMEEKICELQRNAKCVGETQKSLIGNLNRQCACIDNMKDELRRSEQKYCDKIRRLEESEKCLRNENRLLKNELVQAHIDRRKLHRLQEQNKYLCRNMHKLKDALIDYDEQYSQLLNKISTFKNQGYTFSGQSCCKIRCESSDCTLDSSY